MCQKTGFEYALTKLGFRKGSKSQFLEAYLADTFEYRGFNLPTLTEGRSICNLSINFSLCSPQELHKFTKTALPQNENGKNIHTKVFELNLES